MPNMETFTVDNELQRLMGQKPEKSTPGEPVNGLESEQPISSVPETEAAIQPESKPVPEPEPEPEPQKPIITVTVSNDSLTASINFSRIATETIPPTEDEVYAALSEKGVVWGIDEKYLKHICGHTPYGITVDIASGVTAKIGKDGYLKYLINTKKDMRPKERPDGTVDYYDLGFIQNVKKDQPLCEVHLPEKGADGHNVYGSVLEGMYGREADVPIGKNTRYDKERNLVISEVDGNAEVSVKGLIDVHDVLKIPGNVDNSTGNLFFVGDIIIGKDVASGFKVESQGNIIVQGTVEGAHLNAKGDITVGQSINGMNRARIIAGGSLKCKYIQYCHVETGENIYAESVMHCTIECSGNMELSGKRGSLIGGKLVIAKALNAKNVGTESHVATHVTVAGGGLTHNKRILDIKKEINALDTELIMLVQTMNWCESLLKKKIALKPFQLNAYEHGKVRLGGIKEDREKKVEALQESQRELNNVNPADCYIKCAGKIHTGVKIMFGMHTLSVKSSFANCRVYLYEGEIIVSQQ